MILYLLVLISMFPMILLVFWFCASNSVIFMLLVIVLILVISLFLMLPMCAMTAQVFCCFCL